MNEHDYQQRIAELEQQVTRLQSRNDYLEEQFRLAQQKQFGSSSESYPGHQSTGQGELFNEAEQAVDLPVDVEQETIEYTRNKPKRKPLPEDLPREVVVHDIPESEKVCECCQGELHQLGEDKSEKLEFIPAKVKVIEHVRPKYGCRHCERHGIESVIKQAPVPNSVIPKGYATPSLLSQIITSKYQYGLPLYRQESLFKQYGIELSRKTMADWVIRSADILQMLYDRLRATLLQQSVIQADETTLKVVKEDKSTCYMWLYCCGTDSPNKSHIPNIVLYDYQRSRSGQCAADFLDGYDRYLQCDGYVGYEQTQATLVGCWAHVRRKFMEAKQSAPKGKSGKADMALNLIQKLYGIEKSIKDNTPEEKQRVRQEKALPQLIKLKAYLDKSANQVPPKSALGKAITYSLNQWPKLVRYTQDGNQGTGHLNIDNNRPERAIKPFVIGRKNWLFANTPRGAKASAILYSIIETAKANGLMPFDYLHHLLEQINQPDYDVEHCLPWAINKS